MSGATFDDGTGEDAEHEVELVHDGETVSLSVSGDEYILDAAEDAGFDLPYSCRQGQCTSCVGKVLEGAVDQSEGTALDPMQQDDGYALLCVSYPTSDCRIETEAQGDMFGGDLDVF
ncbi:2Fe-2S iron-sulfur cluster-binding protein [Halorientalis brevis]|uniref:2Fe-2S iron-sulfur cluster-binding protein n=1 Tax=Halorientalis brevis TaxID=1126241 RepID=A0ABD6CB01_9EURY|nr:2Fe-2S iron-sulfur cluster-binding protein [Halorientalis brevis]